MELQQTQEQSVRIVIREDILSVVLGLIVIVRKMDTGCYKVGSDGKSDLVVSSKNHHTIPVMHMRSHNEFKLFFTYFQRFVIPK